MQKLFLPFIATLLLGLAPFGSEPHLIGKIRWVAGGAKGMAPMDWFDLVMHGAPVVWLVVAVVQVVAGKLGSQSAESTGAGDDQASGGS